MGIKVPIRAQYIRVMFDEITRILNHLLWLGAHGLDVGAMAVFLCVFREREDLMDCYEAVSELGFMPHITGQVVYTEIYLTKCRNTQKLELGVSLLCPGSIKIEMGHC